jgi:hypothetical protein
VNLAEVAFGLGYPDAFALSNQMMRLAGVRPALARERAGWEWPFERWLCREEALGCLRGLSRAAGVPHVSRQNPSPDLPSGNPGVVERISREDA